MYGARQLDELLDPFGLEVPFSERFDPASEAYPGSSLNLSEETFVMSPGEAARPAGDGLSWLETAVQLAEAEASGDSAAEWLGTEWLDTAGGDAESVEAFAERLGREWSRRRNGDPTPEAMKIWLIQDHADTMTGARLRWPRQKNSPVFWPRVTAAWQVCRENHMRFQTEPGQGVAALGPFAPPATRVDLVSDPIVSDSDKAPIAPLTLRFARELRRRLGGVNLTNYRGHGLGAFLNRGYSLDLFLAKRDARGYYIPEDAVRLLRAVNAAAQAVGVDWRAIYNDYSVANAINAEFRRRHVIFVGGLRRNKAKQVTGLNWHGPDPLILHVHLDLAPRPGTALGEAEAGEAREAPQFCASCRGAFSSEGPGYEAEWMETQGEPEQGARQSEDEELAWLDYEGGRDGAGWPALGQEAEGYETGWSEDAAEGLDHDAAAGVTRLFEGALFEALESTQPFETYETASSSVHACPPYPAGYEKLIRRRGGKDGEVIDRTQGDRATNLSLQFRDYDVNAYLAGEKSAHATGLATITEFINARVAGTDVEVTITGSASRTGTRQFNQDLSEKRASCMAQMLRTSLVGAAQARTRFNEHGEGFESATCQGADCELPGYRSVLVSVHSPNRPPPPVPPEPDTWDKYEIRCCAFQSLALGEVALDELLKRLPGGLPRAVAERLAPILRKRVEALLKRLLGRLPRLASLGGELSTLLRFLPIEVTRQNAVFQVRERGKPTNPRQITLCYDGWGGRLALPIPGKLDDALDELLKKVPAVGQSDFLRHKLKNILREELEKLLPRAITNFMAKLDSNVPGPWKAFDLNRRERLEVFRGPADIFVDVITNLSAPGHLTLAFDGRRWNDLDRARRVAIKLPNGETSVIVLQVDGGVGFDLLSVNKGELVDKGCECTIEGQTEVFELA